MIEKIKIGEYNTLQILRETTVGLYLGAEGDDEHAILLPNKYCPEKYELGDELTVFVYLDYAERMIATTLRPKIELNKLALLRCSSVERVGAFLDWGLEKELLVPFSEQRMEMEVDRWYVVFMLLDDQTGRLFATNKFEKRLLTEAKDLTIDQRVELLIYRKTDLGYAVAIDDKYKGLLYKNEIFETLNVGDRKIGYVKVLREDGKVDVSLQPIGYLKSNDVNVEKVLTELRFNHGYLDITDKSPPEDIYKEFGISKKAFKKAIGFLYKNRQIVIDKDGIRLA